MTELTCQRPQLQIYFLHLFFFEEGDTTSPQHPPSQLWMPEVHQTTTLLARNNHSGGDKEEGMMTGNSHGGRWKTGILAGQGMWGWHKLEENL